MIYTEKTKSALRICFAAHKNQLDKGGMPYVFHPFHLAEQMQTEETVIAALLHDVIEDSTYTMEDLKKYDFPESVLEAVSLLTKDDTLPYPDYIRKIKQNPIARAVKLADLRHNSDLTRLLPCQIDASVQKRNQKYQEAIRILEENQEK